VAMDGSSTSNQPDGREVSATPQVLSLHFALASHEDALHEHKHNSFIS